MKAVTYSRYGTPDVFELKEVEKPYPQDNEVLIKVFAVSINDWDWQLLQGIPFMNRMMNGLSKPKKQILGSDIAGRIESVGRSVTKFKSGDEVYGDLSGTWGGFAEYVCANENSLELKPASMTFEQAASIPQAAMLAVQGLLDIGNVQSRKRILINGAGGGVGTFGIQIAKQYHVEVTGVDSTEKLEIMKSIGFDYVIDYTREDFTKNGKCYDLILDTKTNRSVFDYLRVLSPNGMYVTVGGSLNRILQVFVFRFFTALTIKKKLRIIALKPNKDLIYMNKLFETGKVRPVIDGPFMLEDIAKAFRHFGEGKHKGKVVITLKTK
jgi:NADPH:quinone reductase-like Zn-dependent oxidoreductase